MFKQKAVNLIFSFALLSVTWSSQQSLRSWGLQSPVTLALGYFDTLSGLVGTQMHAHARAHTHIIVLKIIKKLKKKFNGNFVEIKMYIY